MTEVGERAAWESDRARVLAAEAALRAGASIRPLHLEHLAVDPLLVLEAERLDPFWRRPVPPRGTRPSTPIPPLGAGPDGTLVLARRWWIDVRDHAAPLMLQTLLAAPASPDGDAHTDLARWDDETRGWALVALADAGYDPSACRVQTRVTEWWAVTGDDRGSVGWAPNALPDPDPVFAALDQVGDAQRWANRADVRRVTAALGAWRAALREEGAPRSSGTPYQKGFLVDLARRLDVAETTAQVLVHTAEDLATGLPECWARFAAGDVPWRGMQKLHAAIEGLDPALLPEFDGKAAQKLGAIPVSGLKDALHRVRERLQPAEQDERHERARAGRRVTIESAPDGMAWLHALMPAHEALALDHQLTRSAIAAHGRDGETRTIGQLRVDAFRDGITGVLRRDARGADLLVPGRCGVQPTVAVLIPAMTALGHSDAPVILQGYGPIGIRTALRIAGHATSWIRVLTDPLTGAIRTIGRDKYRPTKDMRTWLALLDGGSRGPGTVRRPDESDMDHLVPYRQHGGRGETGLDNLLLLSRRDHGAKTAGVAAVHLLRDRTVVWRSASGATHVTRPHDPPDPTPVPPELIDPADCPF